MEMLKKLNSRFDKFEQNFDRHLEEMDKRSEERGKMSKEPMKGLQHVMQQLRPAVEAGACGEKDWRALRRRRRERRAWRYSV